MTGSYDYALWLVGVALIAGGFLGLTLVKKKSEARLRVKS
jgi:hypothetical protein